MNKNEYQYEESFNKLRDKYKNNEIVIKFLDSMNEDNKKAMVISMVVLESSFDIERCIGYKDFVNTINS